MSTLIGFLPRNSLRRAAAALLMGLLVAGICRAADTNSFGVYLLVGRFNVEDRANALANLAQVGLKHPPLATESDVVALDLTNHLLTLTSDAYKRFSEPKPYDTKFVVTASGQRVFVGIFWSNVYTQNPSPLPRIMIDRPSGTARPLPENSVQLLDGGMGGLWADARIRHALETLHKVR